MSDYYFFEPNPSQPEYYRRFKPENNRSGGFRDSGSCDTPSMALKGSALYEWEKIHGKLITTITYVQNECGRTIQVVEKKPCPPEPQEPRVRRCTAVRYKVA